jgi:hypothetical protein
MEMIDLEEINNIKFGYNLRISELEDKTINNFNDIDALKIELFDIYNTSKKNI